MGRAALALLVLLGLGVCPVLAATDKAAPTVSITSPEPGLTFAAEQVEVTAVYSAAGGAAISRVELLVDGMVVQASDRDPTEESGVLSLIWEASGYLDGKHAVVVRVTDTKGRTAKASIPALLQRGAPEARPPLAIVSPARRATVAGAVPVKIEADRSVKYVIFLVDNVFKAMSNIRPFSFTWRTTDYLNGLHRLQARGYLEDGTDILSGAFDVRVDNPSGATTLKTPTPAPAATTPTPAPAAPAPAPKAAPAAAPEPEAAPARATESVLPAARHTASPTPYSAAAAAGGAEIGAPGTAPYFDSSREVVTPPTTVLAERTASGTELKVATVATATEQRAAPRAAAGASVSAPPAPAPTSIAASTTETALAASTSESAAATTAPEVAPVQVAALPTPASAPARAEAAGSLPPLGAATVAQPMTSAAASSAAITSRPLALAKTSSAPVSTPAPVTVARVEAAVVPVAPVKAALVSAPAAPVTKPVVAVAKVAPAKPVASAPVKAGAPVAVAAQPAWAAKPPVVKVALLPTPAAPAKAGGPAKPAGLAAEPTAVEQVVVNGDVLRSDQPMVVVADANGNKVHLLPLRAVVEQLNGIVLWQHEEKRAIVDARGNHVVVTIQQIAAKVNGQTVQMEVRPVIVGGRTLVQARFLAEALKLSLDVEGGTLRLAVN